MAILNLEAAVRNVIGTDVQAYDAFLTSIATLGTAADKMIYTTAADTAAETALTAFGRSLIDDANEAAGRTTLGLIAGGAGDIWVEKAGDTMTGALIDTIEDAATNIVTDILTLGHNSSGTPAADFGAGLLLRLASDSTPDQDAARIAAEWSDPAHATRGADTVFYNVFNGGSLTETLRIQADGELVNDVIGTSTGFSAAHFHTNLDDGNRPDQRALKTTLECEGQSNSRIGSAAPTSWQSRFFNRGNSTLTEADAVQVYIDTRDTSDITRAYGIRIFEATYGGTSTIGTFYGLYVDALTGADTADYAIYTNAGAVRLGDKTTILQPGAAGAAPVLTLTQTDVSEEMMEFACTIGVGNAIEAVDGKTLTATHFIKCTIAGVGSGYLAFGDIA